MAQEETQAPVLAVDNTAELALAQAALSTAQLQIAELTTKFAEAQALLDAIASEKATLVANAATARLQARKEAIEASVGTDKADALLAATDSLDDVAFKAVVGAMAMSFEKEASSQLFKEVGVAGSVDAKAVEESPEMKALKVKYAAK